MAIFRRPFWPPPPTHLWVPSLASSDVSIDCTVGTATANGTSAKLDVAINAAVGTATASGTSAKIDETVNASVGTATANGIAGAIDTGGSTTIDCSVGTATASGTQAAIDEQVACAVGTATASGVTCTFTSAAVDDEVHASASPYLDLLDDDEEVFMILQAVAPIVFAANENAYAQRQLHR